MTVAARPGAEPRAVAVTVTVALTMAGALALAGALPSASAAAALSTSAEAEPGRPTLAAGAAVAPPVTLTFPVRSASATLSLL